jgi:hypothetical protein
MGVHESRLFTIEGKAAKDKHIGETLDTKADGTMLHVRAPCCLHGIEVAIDDPIEILRDNLGRLMESIIVEGLCILVDIFGESN